MPLALSTASPRRSPASFRQGRDHPAAGAHLHRQAQAVYLPTAAPGLGDSGVIIGREVYSGKGYIYDPFQLYGQQLPAPHWLVLGESGNGKSALEKTYVLRQLRFRDRQVVVLDAQGEDGVGEWNLIAEGSA